MTRRLLSFGAVDHHHGVESRAQSAEGRGQSSRAAEQQRAELQSSRAAEYIAPAASVATEPLEVRPVTRRELPQGKGRCLSREGSGNCAQSS